MVLAVQNILMLTGAISLRLTGGRDSAKSHVLNTGEAKNSRAFRIGRPATGTIRLSQSCFCHRVI